MGNSQDLPGASDSPNDIGVANGVHYLILHSVLATYFPVDHLVGFLMNVMTHPQMLALQRFLLGSERIFLDHSMLLTRTSFPGAPWHSHHCVSGPSPYDDSGPCASTAEYDRQPNTLLCLCYPNGFR